MWSERSLAEAGPLWIRLCARQVSRSRLHYDDTSASLKPAVPVLPFSHGAGLQPHRLLVTSDSQELLTDEDPQEWSKALAEYQETLKGRAR